MEFDPHTLHQILQRIKQQMRCPQCGEKVPIDFASVRLSGDDFLLLQLKCEICDAYIVLHASLQGAKPAGLPGAKEEALPSGVQGQNASSSICLKEGEVEVLRGALEGAGGSFARLFESLGKE